MTDMSKKTMKLALEGAANYIDALGGDSRKYRQALADQPAQQEPVEKDNSNYRLDPPGLDPRYTSPPAQRKPLTDEQIDAAVKAWFENDIVAGRQPFAKRMRAAIEAVHGIKGDA